MGRGEKKRGLKDATVSFEGNMAKRFKKKRQVNSTRSIDSSQKPQ